MEGIVAKRCLRQSSIGKEMYESRVNKKNRLNEIYRKNNTISKSLHREESNTRNRFEKFVFKTKMKLWIQSISAMCIIILLIVISMLNVSVIDNNKYVIILKEEYGKNYSLEYIKLKAKSGMKYGYKGLKYVVSDRVENQLRGIYSDIKNIFKKDNNNVMIYEEIKDNQVSETSDDVKNGIGVSIDENAPSIDISDIKEESSAISIEDNSLNYIKNNNIKFIMPTKGTISSSYGAREVIFKDIDSYHTGIDIANKKGTDIVAATDGIVTKVANNKYNGNFIEITYKDIITKYAHMDSVNVKKGKEIKAGEKIGVMGESGYATGPHLHFEIVVKGIKIDPAKVLNL